MLLNPPNDKNYIEMQRARPGKKTQVWKAWTNGVSSITQWGVLDGKIQQTVDIPGYKGKKETKSFVTPEQSAKDLIIKEATLKYQRGYLIVKGKETDIGKAVLEKTKKYSTSTQKTFDNWEGPLPNNLCFSKPVNSISKDSLSKYENKEVSSLIKTIKINGMMHVVSKDNKGNVYLQTRGKMNVVNEHYPHLVREFDHLLPKNTIVLCELFMHTGSKLRHFKLMQKIANSLPERALEQQKELGLVQAYLFRIPFCEGVNLEEETPVGEIFNLIEEWTNNPQKTPHIHPVEIIDMPWREAQIDAQKFEGLVLYLKGATFKGKGHNFLGNPDRPGMCWKLKPILEDDFIAIFDPDGPPSHCISKCANIHPIQDFRCPICGVGLRPNGSYGTGKNKHRVGAISLYQLNKYGELIYISDVSSGLTDKQKEEITSEYKETGQPWSKCIQVEYRDRNYLSRGDDSNSLQHPTFKQIRMDKFDNECVSNLL